MAFGSVVGLSVESQLAPDRGSISWTNVATLGLLRSADGVEAL